MSPFLRGIRALPNKRLTRQAAFGYPNALLVEACRVFAQANAMLAKTTPSRNIPFSIIAQPIGSAQS